MVRLEPRMSREVYVECAKERSGKYVAEVWRTLGADWRQKQGVLDRMSYNSYERTKAVVAHFREAYFTLGFRLPVSGNRRDAFDGVASFMTEIGVANKKIRHGKNSEVNVFFREDLRKIKDFLDNPVDENGEPLDFTNPFETQGPI
ncbi:MAG: hypothetical protein AAB512_03135 [Patescibacteria group bacterium]